MTGRWSTWLAGIAALALCVGVAVLDKYHLGAFHDDAIYVILAKSLATGHGYHYLHLPGAPLASHFPPGYPFVLSLLWRIAPVFPANVVLFKVLNVVLLAVNAALIAQLVRERFDSMILGATAGITTALSIPMLVLTTMVLSEQLFLALVLATLLLSERMLGSVPSARRALLAGILIGAATLVRTHGFVLLPALVLALIVGRQWRNAALVGAGAAILVLPWQLWSASSSVVLAKPLAGNYGSYVAWWLRGVEHFGLTMIPLTLKKTTLESASTLTTLFLPLRGTIPRLMTLAAMAIAFGIGYVATARRAPVTALFLFGYSAIVLLWPFPPSRFIWGIWPIVLFVLAGAVWFIDAKRGAWPRASRVAIAACVGWMATGYLVYELHGFRGQWWSSISRSADARIAGAIAQTSAHTQQNDLVAADDDGAIYLYAGRPTVPAASFTTEHYLGTRTAQVEAAEGLVPLISEFPVRVVIVGSRPTYDAAELLTFGPAPLLGPGTQYSEGVVYPVIKR